MRRRGNDWLVFGEPVSGAAVFSALAGLLAAVLIVGVAVIVGAQ